MKAKLLVILGLIALPVAGTIAMSSHHAMQQETTGQYVDSSVITLKVKSKLLADPDIKGLAISVKSNKGQVTLAGFANTWAQKQKAGMLAKQVEGVTGVTNNIVVKMHPFPSK
jgi:hyperosmotically inducible periplasmic protein